MGWREEDGKGEGCTEQDNGCLEREGKSRSLWIRKEANEGRKAGRMSGWREEKKD